MKRIPGYVGARSAIVEPRWIRLLEAALEQPYPSPALQKAIEGLRSRSRNCVHFDRQHLGARTNAAPKV